VEPPPVPVPDTAAMARVMGGLRGNFAGRMRERRLSAEILRRWPHVRGLVRAADAFASRAALYAAQDGQNVLFGTAGYPFGGPHGDPPHAAALAAVPDARFTYADASEAITMLRVKTIELAGEQDRVTAVACPLSDPAGIIAAGAGLDAGAVRAAAATGSRAAALEALAGARPLMVQFSLAAPWGSGDYAAWLLGEYRRLLPSGSSVTLALFSPDGDQEGEALLGLLAEAGRCAARAHGRADVEGWVKAAGLELHPWGVTEARSREQALADARMPARPPGAILEAVARVP
jgi:hypothetical protein